MGQGDNHQVLGARARSGDALDDSQGQAGLRLWGREPVACSNVLSREEEKRGRDLLRGLKGDRRRGHLHSSVPSFSSRQASL